MQLSNTPGKLVLPFANAGGKNAIPAASQIGITPGAASLEDGFPPVTRTPLASGGVPPSGLDMNGVLFEMSAVIRWTNAGGGYAYDGTFAADSNVGGYPKGARLLRSDGLGYWLNTVENNTTDPDDAGAAAAGWMPDFAEGASTVTMTNANVTLTPLQYGKRFIVITGALAGNLNLVFPAIVAEWVVINSTSGAYAITCKTSGGTGVEAPQGAAVTIYGNATNIEYSQSVVPQAEAETGTATALKGWSALRVRQAIQIGVAKVVASNGYVRFPTWLGGFIFQWGVITSSAVADTAVTYNLAYATATYLLVGSSPFASQVSFVPVIGSQTTTGFSFNALSPGGRNAISNYWFSLGI